MITTLIMVLLIEGCLRWFAPQIHEHDTLFQPDKELGWSFIPNAKGRIVYPGEVNQYVSINAQGFRDIDFDLDTSKRKIMVIGDSFVTNIAVEADEVFTEVMESQLDNTAVMNFGVNGYGQVQELLLLNEWLSKVQPGLIIQLVYLRNDFRDNVKADNWLYPKPTAVLNQEQEVSITPTPKIAIAKASKKEQRKGFLEKLHLYHFVRNRLGNIAAKTNANNTKFRPPEVDLCAPHLRAEIRTQFEVLQQLLLQTKEKADAFGVPIVFVLAPSIGQVQDASWEEIRSYADDLPLVRDLPNQRLMEFAKQHELSMLDLLPALLDASTAEGLLYNQFEQHWTVKGNAVVGEEILEYISDL